MQLINHPLLLAPALELPPAYEAPRVLLKVPEAEIPSYIPMVIPPADLERPEGVQAEEGEETTEQPATPTLRIPIIDIQMPVPPVEVVVTAVTTAVVAVATTTVAQSLFEPIKKKVQKQLQSRVDAWKKKRKEKISSIKSKESEENLKKNK